MGIFVDDVRFFLLLFFLRIVFVSVLRDCSFFLVFLLVFGILLLLLKINEWFVEKDLDLMLFYIIILFLGRIGIWRLFFFLEKLENLELFLLLF